MPEKSTTLIAERRAVRLLDVDPDLGRDLSPEELANARRFAVAPVQALSRGAWSPADSYPTGETMLGLYVVKGFLARNVLLGGRSRTELLGPGDLLRPWDHADAADAPVPSTSSWRVLEPVRLAVLNRAFAGVIGRWPELTTAFVSRAMRRSRWLALSLAIDALARVDLRVEVLLWHLADRWGEVRDGGVVVPLRLTHQMLAQVVGARRPSITTALTELDRRGSVRKLPEGGWLLLGRPPEVEAPLLSGSGAAARLAPAAPALTPGATPGA